MKVLKIAVAVLLAFCLASCGNGGARPKGKKSTKGQATTTPTTPPTTPSTATTPATPATTQPTETTKPAETTKPGETAKPAETTKPAETPKPAPAPDVLVAKPSGFESEDIGGKSIGYWVEKLNSKNKEELLEAIEYCRMVGGKASLGIVKLSDLAKNTDPEISKAANDALHAVRTVKP